MKKIFYYLRLLLGLVLGMMVLTACPGNDDDGKINPENADSDQNSITQKEGDRDASGNLLINEKNFLDANFRNWLKRQSYGSDGVLTDEEIAGVTSIVVYSKSIQSLKGIEYFTALTGLDCDDNQLTSLDVSKNTALTSLTCRNNQLTSLDLLKNSKLDYLDCSYNKLTSLDLPKNSKLEYLDCVYNELTSLDVSNSTNLKKLRCFGNFLTSLDVSGCTKLKWLDCADNELTSLDVSECTALEYLFCSYNYITSLDVSKNTKLGHLDYDKEKQNGKLEPNDDDTQDTPKDDNPPKEESLVEIVLVEATYTSLKVKVNIKPEVASYDCKVLSDSRTYKISKEILFYDLTPGRSYNVIVTPYDSNKRRGTDVSLTLKTVAIPYDNYILYRDNVYSVDAVDLYTKRGSSTTGANTKYLKITSSYGHEMLIQYSVHTWEGISSVWGSGTYKVVDDNSDYYTYFGVFYDPNRSHTEGLPGQLKVDRSSNKYIFDFTGECLSELFMMHAEGNY